MTIDEVNEKFKKITDKLDDTQRALLSEDLLDLQTSVVTDINGSLAKDNEIQKMKEEKIKLLEVNGKLAQRVAFEEQIEPTFNNAQRGEPQQNAEAKIDISDFISEKGEIINAK